MDSNYIDILSLQTELNLLRSEIQSVEDSVGFPHIIFTFIPPLLHMCGCNLLFLLYLHRCIYALIRVAIGYS
jgi:hypothetical protein